MSQSLTRGDRVSSHTRRDFPIPASPNERGHLARAPLSTVEDLMQESQLCLAAHERSEPASGIGLQSGVGRLPANQLQGL